MTSSRLDSHPHTDQVKPSNVSNRVGMNLIGGYAIQGVDWSVERKSLRDQAHRKMLQKPCLMVRRMMLRTVIWRGHADIKARHTRAKERKENRDLKWSGLWRTISVVGGLLPGFFGRREPMRGFGVRGRGFFTLGLLQKSSNRKLVDFFLFGLISKIAKGLWRTHILKKIRKDKVPENFSGIKNSFEAFWERIF